MSELVTVEIDDHVAHVRLNRPEKMNALSWQSTKTFVRWFYQEKVLASARAWTSKIFSVAISKPCGGVAYRLLSRTFGWLQIPKTVVFTEFPKTSTGKIQRFVLRQQVAA